MGDPAGVGPEVILQALHDDSLRREVDLVVFGDVAVLQRCAKELGVSMPAIPSMPLSAFAESANGGPADAAASGPLLVDLQNIDADRLQVGQVDKRCGRASFDYIQAAIDAALAGQIASVTTAPINKEALRSAGIDYPGHTEMFAERAQSDRWCMMQYSREITCTFVTVHVGYAEVPDLLTEQSVLDTIELTAVALRSIRKREPKIVVCGLNPHAGENGLFGNREEERIILPAIERARAAGMDIEGPLPPDTAFLPWKREATDAFVCMYHDQGHIPVKALAFDAAVNTTLGLSIIRTSVDHGTAYDIAWQGKARASSLFSAIRLADQLAQQRA